MQATSFHWLRPPTNEQGTKMAKSQRRQSRYAARRLGEFETLEPRRLLAVVPAGYTETVLASELTSPTTLDIEEGGRIWVAYQDGRIEVIEDGAPGTTLAYQLDCDGSAEHGLQGLELDPNFESNGYLYVYYTANSPQPHNRLSRLTVDPTTEDTILAGSELVLIDLPNLSDYGNPPWHIGGAVHFGLDGTLYLQIGESQQSAQSQDLESQLGKIFHINSDGSVPTNNPYYDAGDGITWRDYVWASGLRNPFAGDLNPVTGRYFVADVGQGSWEEINDATLPGLNFGWPTTEGNFNQQTYPDFTLPVYTYSHANGCAITGGAFNIGGTSPFSAEYDGKFFFSEFCGGEVRVIDPDNPATAQVFATNADFPMNIEFGPDGSLYYISRGAGAGGAPGIETGSVRKISYGVNAPPSIVIPPGDQLVSVGYDASFTVEAAGTEPLEYQWQLSAGGSFTDIPGATGETLIVPNTQLTDSGNQYQVVVTNSLGSVASSFATLTVTSDTPPTPYVTLPVDGTTYRAGDTITYSGGADDLEDGSLAADKLTWRVDFHHNVHSHPFIAPTSGITGGQFTIPIATETDSDVWYRINLTATDSAGLTTKTFRDVFPEKSDFVVETNLPENDGSIAVDGHDVEAPFAATGVENVQRTLAVPTTQTVGADTVYFVQWLDGDTNAERTILTPQDDTAYVALYQSFDATAVYLSDLTPQGTPANGWGPIEFDTSNGEDNSGDGNPITLNGIVYDKGLGVHAYSEVTYDLAGSYSHFFADVGVDDENAPGGTVVFRVLADGNEVFNSGTMANASTTQAVNVSVLGADALTLIVEDAGDGNGSDHADWADARLVPNDSPSLVDINFQLDGVETPTGYLADSGQVFADRGNGWNYGWSSDHTDVSRDRDINADQLLDTLLHFHGGQNWEIEVPDGTYSVRVSIGDAGFPSTHTLNVEGLNYWDALPLDSDEFAAQAQIVTVNDGRLTLDMGSAGDKSTRINYIEISEAATEGTLLPFSAADVDLNSRLDLNDVIAFASGWGSDGTTAPLEQRIRQGDLDFDGDTDADDWNLFHTRWLQENNAPLNLNAVLNPIPGDYNFSGVVTAADREVWSDSYASTTYLAADGNGDLLINGADFLLWQRNLGNSVAPAPALDALVLFVDPKTGEGQLQNNTSNSLDLDGYSIVSEDASLLPSGGEWNSLHDQPLTGWAEAAPTTSDLSELNPVGSLSLEPGAWISLGNLLDLTKPHRGHSLEFGLDTIDQSFQGYVVLAELPASINPVTTSLQTEQSATAEPTNGRSPDEEISLWDLAFENLGLERDRLAFRPASP